MTIQEAARELRKHLAKSQQAMATDLGLSMGALRNYESGAVETPDTRSLYRYTMTAELANRPDLAMVFRVVLYRELGAPPGDSNGQLYIEPKDDFERILITALLASIRGIGEFQQFQMPVFESLNKPLRTLNRLLTLGDDVRTHFNNRVVDLYASSPKKFLLAKIKEAK